MKVPEGKEPNPVGWCYAFGAESGYSVQQPEPIPIGPEWTEISTDEDIAKFMKLIHNFDDSVLVRVQIETGNFAENHPGRPCTNGTNMNRTYLLFHSEYNNPYAIELLFDRTHRLHFFANEEPGFYQYFFYAKIVKNDEYYYWTPWEEFDPYNQEHISSDDIFMVEGRKLYYRIVQMHA